MVLLVVFILAYLVGSIPTGWLRVRKHGIDLRTEGSGNIGAMNSYEVTKSRSVGVQVLVLDLLKGALPVALVLLIGYATLTVVVCFGVLLGHCYSAWLKFRGGRGLASAAGAALVLNPLLLSVWFAGMGLGWLIKKQVHAAAIVATIISLVAAMTFSDNWIVAGTPHWTGLHAMPDTVRGAIILMLVVIFSRHLKPLKLWVTGELE